MSDVQKKLVLIVGAGASNEYGLPLGAELKGIISKSLSFEFDVLDRPIKGNQLINDAILQYAQKHTSGDTRSIYKSAKIIRDGIPLSISIDNFINSHKGDAEIEVCGKLGIALSILQAERQSSLFIERHGIDSLNFHSIESTWLVSFFKLITEDRTLSDLRVALREITIITFNYDRCIEHFLEHALSAYYFIDLNTSRDLVSQLEIIHPYGAVGYYELDGSKLNTSFGGLVNPSELLTIATSIKTFSEGISPASKTRERIRHAIDSSNIICFVGFAFHQINMNLLGATQSDGKYKNRKYVIASAYGLSKSDLGIIQQDISSRYLTPIENAHLSDKSKAVDIFHEYRRLISQYRQH